MDINLYNINIAMYNEIRSIYKLIGLTPIRNYHNNIKDNNHHLMILTNFNNYYFLSDLIKSG